MSQAQGFQVRDCNEPVGGFHLIYFATPDSNSTGHIIRWLHSGHRLKDNSDEQISQPHARGWLVGCEVGCPPSSVHWAHRLLPMVRAHLPLRAEAT
jgi:hypothetical protein